ncbi:histidinol-phosphatase [Limnochorda pilosa]|uniref:Histidinol-phosphatase n=1 Tax=Limnochorda pilosa TaxID=1555112 RepID=A0A0K2SQD4_LIMPI|nr:histidinol-phosphatase [Limnochorda pilosa]BAS29311.1 histidinol phosphatase [Limnochorda pilosa]
MPADYHMHLEADDLYEDLPHTVARIAEYVEAARRAGVDEIGISEHCHRFRAFRPIMAHLFEGATGQHPHVVAWLSSDFRHELNRYVEVVLDARRQGLPVRLGLEVDYLPDREEAIARALDGIPWDYVLGSVHFVDGASIDSSPEITWPGTPVERLWRRYFEHLAQAAASGLFTCLAHPDLPKKFGFRSDPFPWDAFEPVVEAAAATGTGFEVNTAGLRKPAREIYPAQELLAAATQRGLPIQLGSDAHRPEEVGAGFAEALRWARDAGATALTRRAGRRAVPELLGGSLRDR